MIWFWGVLCALALVALFFPFVFWMDFTAGLEGVKVQIRLFKKNLYTYKKNFKKKQPSQEEEVVSVDKEEEEAEAVAPAPAPKVEKSEAPKPEPEPEQKAELECKPESENKPAEKKEEPKPSEEKSSDADEKEKRSLTDQEFWTLLLTPEFDSRAWWAVRHALSALFRLFRIRFVD